MSWFPQKGKWTSLIFVKRGLPSSPVAKTAATAEGTGSIPDQGTKIPQAMRCKRHPRPPKTVKWQNLVYKHTFQIADFSLLLY